jgi:glutaredoxin
MQKKWLYKSALLFALFALTVMQGSSTDDYGYDYYAVYMHRDNLEKSVSYVEPGKEMKNPGKIYYKHPYLFINEKYKGVHVYDNTNPASPVKKGFIIAPGCLDMAVKDNILYLDNAVDMVSFDLSKMKEVKRIPEVFPELAPPSSSAWYDSSHPEGLIIVEWIKNN